ncbi:MAG: hypothetical protein M0Q40_09995 [Limnochordia bacterium]|nr:hypothetical protein [Limnochordia bacterium]
MFKEFADLDVLYISRTPRYERFTVIYDEHGPASYSGGLWPSVGTEVLFTAVVSNKGNLTSSPLIYQWWIDDQLVESGSHPAMPPGHRQEFSIPWQWQEEAGQVQFVVLAEDVSNELSERNNSRRIWTDALSFKFFVEPGVYEVFNSLKNMTGTYSFEDWAWAHIDRMDGMFEQCGVVESVFIDEVEVVDNLPNVGEHAPLALEWDGRWGWDDREWTPNKIEREMGAVQYTLIHELMHQLGIIDEYNFNFDPNYRDRNEVNQEIFWYPYKGIMNDLNSRTLSSHTQNALNANKGFRRGFFGEYLYDLPRHNTIILKDQEGNVLSHAKIKIYQTDSNRILNEPVIEGMTDVHGRFILPNREISKEIITPTGHQLRANPFGHINVVGLNGLFLCEAQIDGNKVYGWLGIWEFNLAYWNGNEEEAEYTVVVR